MKDNTTIQRPWTTNEAADFLGIHPRTVTRMARGGQLPAFRIGSLWRFLPSDLDSWMRSQVCFMSKLNIPVRSN